MLDQVEERLLAPLDVVEHDDERRLLLEQLPERPGDLLREVPASDSPSSERIAAAAAGSAGSASSCLTTSTIGQ